LLRPLIWFGDAREMSMRIWGRPALLAGMGLAAFVSWAPSSSFASDFPSMGAAGDPDAAAQASSALSRDIMPRPKLHPFAAVIAAPAPERLPMPDRTADAAAARALAIFAGAAARPPGVDFASTAAIRIAESPSFAPAPSPAGRPDTPQGAAIEPELPPDVRDAPLVAPLPPSAPRPLANLNDAPAAGSGGALAPDQAVAPPAASGRDILVALSAIDRNPVLARPLGGGDWRASRDAMRAYYAGRSYAPAWTDARGLTPAAVAALSRLKRAGEDGLDFPALSLPSARIPDATPEQLAKIDVVMSQAVIAYAVEASGGRVDPQRISPDISERPALANPVRALERVLAASDPAAALQDFNPPQKGYRDLREKLAQIRGENPALSERLFPAGPALKIGMIDPRVALIRTRFGLDTDRSVDANGALVYDSRVASAVASFQRANGLRQTGIFNPGTAVALAGGDAARQESIVLANMEMWRWEPRDMGEERVEVNVPDFSLKVIRDGEAIHSARVIVGKPDTSTPIFSNSIQYILVNPSWHVPQSIVKKEMMPKLAKDPDYLTRMGFEVVQKGDSLLVRQPPGERNALGRILFMFPNDHNVYLHDTPSRGLFDAARRAYSHGCIRVDKPLELGEIVMGGAANGWSQQRLHGLVGGGERTIFLPRRIAIHIEYFTAFVDDSGDLQMREDVYGHMRRLQDALGLPRQG
jgi:L,D-transpeptidase YcbB